MNRLKNLIFVTFFISLFCISACSESDPESDHSHGEEIDQREHFDGHESDHPSAVEKDTGAINYN